MRKLTNKEIRNISKALMAKLAYQIDICAFEDCIGLIYDNDVNKIIDNIQKICDKLTKDVRVTKFTTRGIIEEIIRK